MNISITSERPIEEPNISHLQKNHFLEIASSVPLLNESSKVHQSIEESTNIDWKNVSIYTLCISGSITLGLITGISLVGVMVSPIGWAIAISALTIGLIGSAALQSRDTFLINLASSTGTFALGVGQGALIAGAGAGTFPVWFFFLGLQITMWIFTLMYKGAKD